MPNESDERIWYLGYGSMANPVSLKRRGIVPSQSLPVTLDGYDIEFSMNGMANIAEREGPTMHGIAHLVTPQMFEELAKIESVYDYTDVTCRPYDPAAAAITCRAFIVPPDKIAEHKRHLPKDGARAHLELPSQRYIRIIAEGLRHFGADAAWVARIEAEPCNPARPVANWLTAPVAPEAAGAMRRFTLDELAAHKGQLPAVYAIGRKVLQARMGEGHPFEPIYRMISGTQACLFMLMNLYDPSLPPVEGPGDITPVHVAWAEDQAVETSHKYNFDFEQIGVLVGSGGEALIEGEGSGDAGSGVPSSSGGGSSKS